MALGKLNLKLGIDVSNLEKELGKVERSMSRFGSQMQNIGSTMTQSLTLPLLGVGAASLKAFADMEKLENGLIAIMGSTQGAKEELDKLRVVGWVKNFRDQKEIKFLHINDGSDSRNLQLVVLMEEFKQSNNDKDLTKLFNSIHFNSSIEVIGRLVKSTHKKQNYELIVKEMNEDESQIEFVDDRKGHDFRYSINSDKLESLGYKQNTIFDLGLIETINWYKENWLWWDGDELTNSHP